MPWAPTGRTEMLTVRCKPATKAALYSLAKKTKQPVAALVESALADLFVKHKMKVKEHA